MTASYERIGIAHITTNRGPGVFEGNVRWFTEVHPEYAPHDLVDPEFHKEIQLVDYALPSKALRNLDGGVETNNRPGGVYQFEIVAEEQCHDYSDEWYAWLDDWWRKKAAALSIPYVIYPTTERFTFDEWMNPSLRGFYRHINVPENDHRCSWLLDLSRLAQPTKEDDMVGYILRYTPNLDGEPWLAIYDSGRVRYLGGAEMNFLIGPDPQHPKIPFVDESDYNAYRQAKRDAGIIS